MTRRFAGTAKQHEIMTLVLASADQGREIEFHALHGSLSYTATKQALQYSIRYLESHGFIARKYGAKRRCYITPTLLAYQVFRPTPGPLILEDPSPHS